VIKVRGGYFQEINPVDTIMQVSRFVNPEWLLMIEADAEVSGWLIRIQIHEDACHHAVRIFIDAVSVSAFATIRDRCIAASTQCVSANRQTPTAVPGVLYSGLGSHVDRLDGGILWCLSRLGQ
jgi:hypothetical protein